MCPTSTAGSLGFGLGRLFQAWWQKEIKMKGLITISCPQMDDKTDERGRLKTWNSLDMSVLVTQTLIPSANGIASYLKWKMRSEEHTSELQSR